MKEEEMLKWNDAVTQTGKKHDLGVIYFSPVPLMG